MTQQVIADLRDFVSGFANDIELAEARVALDVMLARGGVMPIADGG